LREAQTCRYLVYSEANFDVPPMGVKFGMEKGTEGSVIAADTLRALTF